jgi:hypothetical protein
VGRGDASAFTFLVRQLAFVMRRGSGGLNSGSGSGSRERLFFALIHLLLEIRDLPLDALPPLKLVGAQGDGVAQLFERLADGVINLNFLLHVRGRFAEVANELAERRG